VNDACNAQKYRYAADGSVTTSKVADTERHGPDGTPSNHKCAEVGPAYEGIADRAFGLNHETMSTLCQLHGIDCRRLGTCPTASTHLRRDSETVILFGSYEHASMNDETPTYHLPTEGTIDMTDISVTAPDNKVLICLTHGAEEPENVLIAYLLGVEALRAGKQSLMFLTKDAVHVAAEGFAATIDVPGAPSIAALHDEYVAKGGRMYVCPVCVKIRNMQDAEWIAGSEVAGVPSVFEYTTGGALVFNY